MRCSRCGICCQKTKMPLSIKDVTRLEKVGYGRWEFLRYDTQGFLRLQNNSGYCVFYDVENCSCRIYKYRPLGCHIYPVIYEIGKGVVVHDICPMKNTVSKRELKRKGVELMGLVRKIFQERELGISTVS